MTGYVRTDTTNNIADGNVISAADLDNEFNGVQAAFNSSTGHTHDGSSAEGAPITKLGPTQDVTISATVLGVKTTNTVDLGTSSLKFKDFYLAGAASIGGTLGVTGATTLSAALTYGGVTLSNAVTGTGNMVLSASPTLTGTAGFANITASGTLNVTGIATLTAQPILSSLTASQAVFTDASKGLVSNTITGTGSVVMSASPTLTGTITAAAANFSGAVALNGNATIGDADTDTITQAASYVTGTQLKSAKTATNTLSLAAYDVDGTAYTNLITLTASNTPTLALTSTGVGTINNMSIGATTASTGAFTTLSATDVIKQTGNPSLAAAGATEAFVAHNTGYGAVLYGQGTTYDVALLDRNTTPRLTVTTTAVAVTGTLSATGNLTSPTLQLGTNPAGVSIGVLGIPNQKRVYGRNAANSADVNILYVDGSNGLVFGPSDAAVIDSSGNLGLGVTPSANAGQSTLSISNYNRTFSALTMGSNANSAGYVGYNMGNTSTSNTWKYISADTGSALYFAGNEFRFMQFASGSAGATTTGTQAMTLDSSGNLSIGATSTTGRLLAAGTGFNILGNAYGVASFLQDTTTARGVFMGYDSTGQIGTVSASSNGAASNLAFWTYSGSAWAEKARIDSSGNLLVGAGYISATNTSNTTVATGGFDASTSWSLKVANASTTAGTGAGIYFLGGTNSESYIGNLYESSGVGALSFQTRVSGTRAERMRIDSSGNLLVGTTSTNLTSGGFAVLPTSTGESYTLTGHDTGTSSGATYAAYMYNNGVIGSITQNGTTGVLYNLTSDYRLKKYQQALTGAKDFIMALKPKKWQWWDGSGEGVGFVAHEFMEVAKHSGNGEKDAVDSDGKPVYQSIQPSSSEVMANLVAFVQELKAEFDAYKASHP